VFFPTRFIVWLKPFSKALQRYGFISNLQIVPAFFC